MNDPKEIADALLLRLKSGELAKIGIEEVRAAALQATGIAATVEFEEAVCRAIVYSAGAGGIDLAFPYATDETPLDAAAIDRLSAELMLRCQQHMRQRGGVAGKRSAVLEVINAAAQVVAVLLAGTSFDPKAFEFLRRALADNLAMVALSEGQNEAIEARLQGRRITPPWLDYGRAAHILIDHEGYRGLVAGKEVIATDKISGELVHLLLQDIGFRTMRAAIDDAERA
jgi:hypothetical protein